MNRRQKDGRGGCNPSKLNALENLVRAKKDEIEKLMQSGYVYATHLYERTEQIGRMQSTGQWSSILRIEAYHGQ